MAFGSGDQTEEITLVVDADGAIRALRSTGEELGKLKLSTDKAGEGFSDLQKKTVTLDSALSIAGKAFGILKGAANAVFSTLAAADPLIDVTDAFGTLSQKAGTTADVFAGSLREATDNAITDFELFKAANDALLKGLNPAQFEKVAKTAKLYADATGIDATAAVNQLTEAVSRGNIRVVQQFESTASLAAATLLTGKTAVNAATEFELLSVKAENLSNKFTEAVGRSVAFAEVLRDVGSVLEVIADKAIQAISAIDRYKESLDNAKTAQERFAAAQDIVGLNKGGFSTAALELARKGVSSLGKSLGILEEQTNQAGKATQLATKVYDREYGPAVAGQTKKQESLTEATVKFKTDLKELKDELLSNSKATKTIAEETERLNSEFEKINKLSSEGFLKPGVAAGELGRIAREAEKLGVVLGKVQGPREGTAQEILDANKGFGDGILDGIKEALGLAGADTQQSAAQAGREVAGNFASAFTDVVKAAIAGDNAALKSGLFDILGVGIGAGIGASLTAGSAQGAAIGAQFGDALGDILKNVFGSSDTPGTTARKAADKFFADAFDANRLGVIIEGELVEIRDLVFKGDTLFGGTSDFSTGFAGFFQGLPDAARQAFGGVGAAFEELLGVSGDISGQIGAVLANNIGGSLNNLQLLVQSTGKSFDDLRKAVVEAFLDGKLSALEAQSALNGIAQIATKGIPDGLGLTALAFENLVAAGVKGGRTLVDALGDLGVEASEANLRTFDALAANLINSGTTTADQVALLFGALRANGITSIEQLSNATTEQLLPVLSQLQAEGFQFSEVSRSAEDLVSQLNNIPDEINTTVNVRVNVQDPANALPVVTGGRSGAATGFSSVGIGRGVA